MTLKQLEYFLAIVETGSVTKAAALMHLSQPPMSLQLKALEEELGVTLFTREKKRLMITDQGRLLESYAKQIVSMSEQISDEIKRVNIIPKTKLRIAAISSACYQKLPEVINLFKEIYPHVEFEIFETDTLSVIEMIAAHSADFGFVREPFNNALYNTLPINDSALGENNIDYFCSLGYSKYYEDAGGDTVALCSLKNHPVVIHRRHYNMFVNACKKSGFSPYIICQNDSIWSSIRMAELDIGITVAPYTAITLNTNPNLIVKKIDYPGLVTKTYLTWNRDLVMTRETSAFIDHFRC